MQITKVDINKLIPDSNNARTHSAKNVEAVKSSLAKYSQVEPLVVQKSTNVIIGGNCRWEAMKQLGYTECDVHFVDVDNTQAMALGIILNRTAELADWNEDILSSTLSVLDGEFELDDLGFDNIDLEKMGIFLGDLPDSANGKEFDESCANDVEFITCPECDHKWVK